MDDSRTLPEAGSRDKAVGDAPPRLSIRHFFGMTATVAAVMAVHRLMWAIMAAETRRHSAAAIPNEPPWITAYFASLSISVGGQLFVLASMAAWRLGGQQVTFEPGHWLAICGVLTWSVRTAPLIFRSLLVHASLLGDVQLWIVLIVALEAMLSVICIVLAIRQKHWRAWRWICFVLPPWIFMEDASALDQLVPSLVTATVMGVSIWLVFRLAALAVTIGILIAAVADVRTGTRRHWTHWWGAACFLMIPAFQLGAIAMGF